MKKLKTMIQQPHDTSNFCPGLQAADSDSEELDDTFVRPVGIFDLHIILAIHLRQHKRMMLCLSPKIRHHHVWEIKYGS